MAQAVISLILSIAISLFIRWLTEPPSEDPDPPVDDNPTATSTRGSFVPFLVGVRRIAYIFAWVGERTWKNEPISDLGGGKGKGGSSGPSAPVFYEPAWHLLCVGPAYALHAIYQHGVDLLGYTITRDSHPSGTQITLGGAYQEKFWIFWGETDQPVNTWLGDAGRVGISSRWPYSCYIVWENKRLGTSPQWPFIDYVIECRPELITAVSSDQAWLDQTFNLDTATPYPIVRAVAGVEDTGYFEIAGAMGGLFGPNTKFRVASNHASNDGDYISKSTGFYWYGPGALTNPRTKIFPYGGVPVSVGTWDPATTGAIYLWRPAYDAGCNPAYAIDRLLFGLHPHGMGLDPELFDIDTLDDLATIMGQDGEHMAVSLYGENGEEAQSVLAEIMMDIGLFLRWNAETALWEFKLVREEAVPIQLPDDMIIDPLPEITTVHEAVQPITKLVFSYASWEKRFRKMTLTIDDDGVQQSRGRPKPQTINIPSVIDFVTAAKVAERRAQEALGASSVYRIYAQGDARLIRPGEAISLDDVDHPLRVFTILIEQNSGRVVIEALVDYYAVPLPDITVIYPGTSAGVDEDPVWEPIEWEPIEIPPGVPGEVTTHGFPQMRPAILAPQIRASERVYGFNVYISTDGVTYTIIGTGTTVQSGGELLEALAADGPSYLDEGPTFTALGSDLPDVAQDLSVNEASWRRGEQVVLVGEEVLYVREVTALGGTMYRLDGVIRARVASNRAAHGVGDIFFLFEREAIRPMGSTIIRPGGTYWFKLQPRARMLVPIAQCEPKQITVRGNGVVPPPVMNLRTEGGTNAYSTSDIVIKWAYRYGTEYGSGAGNQEAGEPTAASPVAGSFRLTIKDSGDVEKRVEMLEVAQYTYAFTDLEADFGGSAPSSFKVAVEHVLGGKGSGEVVTTMTEL